MEISIADSQDFLSVFKSKIEEAISIVGLIPEEQREEVWRFWDLVTDTVKLYTSFCLKNTEEPSVQESPDEISHEYITEPPLSITPSKGKPINRATTKLVKKRTLSGKAPRIYSPRGRGIRKGVGKKPGRSPGRNKVQKEASLSDEVTASVIALNDATLNESNTIYIDTASNSEISSNLDISDLIKFPDSSINQEPTQERSVVQIGHILDAFSAPNSVVSQCEVAIPEKKKRKRSSFPVGKKYKRRSGKNVRLRSPKKEGNSKVKGDETNTQQTEVSGQGQSSDTDSQHVDEVTKGSEAAQITDNVLEKENTKENETENEKGKVEPSKNKIRRSKRKPKTKLQYAADGTIDYTKGIPSEVFDEDEVYDDKCDIGMDHAYDEEFKSIMGGKRRKVKKAKTPRTSQDFTCKECGVTLSNTGALTVHMRKHTGSRPFFCEECGKTFTTKANMQRHSKSHTGERPFSCEICEKSFTEKKTLTTHLRLHTGEKPFKCSVCGKCFTQRATLAAHMNIHTGAKHHLCELCGREFNQKANLVTHMKRHENFRRFKCAECNFFFITKGELDRHMIKHTGARPFLCSLCPKSFTRLQYLTEHMNQHTGKKPYSCTKCNIKFHDLSTCHRHAKKHKDQEEKAKESEKENQAQVEIKEEVIEEKNDSPHVVLTDGVLQFDALQQIQETINQQVVKMKQINDEGGDVEQEFQTVIIKGTAEQQAQAIEAIQQQLQCASSTIDSDGNITTVSNVVTCTSAGGNKDNAENSDAQEVYQIWVDPSSNEVMATVDFSAFNLLASATASAKQFSLSNSK